MTRAAKPQPLMQAPRLPEHIAIIMDGNGRWATEHRQARARGHAQGAEALRRLLDSCRARPFIRQVTLYAFSLENWQRPSSEVDDLMNLLRHYLTREAETLHANNIRMRFIGQMETLASDIQRDLAAIEARTANNTALTVSLAISYGARQEITHAMRALAAQVADGAREVHTIDEAAISEYLFTHGMPDPDLLIRTGGEQRLSNFLLWQSAYTELYFTEVLWPDFSAANLDAAIASYSQRERRFGKRNEA